MEFHDGGSRKDDHAYLGLFGRPIRPPDGLQDVSDGVDPGTGGLSGGRMAATWPGQVVDPVTAQEILRVITGMGG